MKWLRENIKLSLQESKKMVDDKLESTIFSDIGKWESEKYKKELEDLGASVNVK
jgi:ribosomal protein L7/L12